MRSKLFWAAAVPVALVGLYALLGFKVAPDVVRDQAQAFVREHYARELAVGAIHIHPFKLQVEVRDLALPDTDGQVMLGFERLFVDFEVASLWNRAFTFRDLVVDAPLVHAVMRPDGSLNLADLALPEEPDEPDEPIPALWIQSLAVERGSVHFTDAMRPTPFAQSFEAVGFSLKDFRTTPEGGDFNFAAQGSAGGQVEWQGNFALQPIITSTGTFRITDLPATRVGELLGEALPFLLTRGTLSLDGAYEASLGAATQVEVTLPRIDLAGIGLRARSADADWVDVPSLVVSDTTLSLGQQKVGIGKVAVTDLSAQAWLAADGSVNLQRLFAPPPVATAAPDSPAAVTPATAPPSPPPDPGATPAGPGQPWIVTVGGIDVANAAIAFEDRSSEPAKKFDLAPVNLRVADASLDLGRPLPVTLDAVINGHARFDANGTLTPEPLAAEFDVKLAKARLQVLQPYVLPLADLTIQGGELDVDGKVTLVPPQRDGPELAFAGDVAIAGFRSVDNALREDFVNFGRLELQKLEYSMGPDALSIDRVLVRQPYARVIVSRDRIVNIAAVLDPEGTAAALEERRAQAAAEAALTPAERRRLEREQESAAKAAEKAERAAARAGTASPAPAPAAAPPPDAFPIRIREVRIEAGRMNFSDNFVQPNFSAEVQDLAGTIAGLSSAYDSRAKVALAGRLDEFSPVSIEGELQPFAFDRYTDLRLKFENIALPIFNPYSGPVAGYNIAKGKLTTGLHYRIENRQLDAQHKIRIDQLEWGDASQTQGEATLPVKFATSLLKDRDGVIDLDVPVGGSLDDPTFRIGPIVWQVIKNLVVKVVAAPFALLGSLFEGAEEAQFVDFAPGEAAVDATTAQRLTALAKSLAEKPELRLDVPIGAAAEIDGPALANRAYDAALAAAVGTRYGKKGEPAPTFDALDSKQKLEVLTALVKQQTGTAPEVPEAPEPPEGTPRAEAKALRDAAAIGFLEQAARAGVVVPEGELERLALERANAVERALLADGTLEATRVFKVREGKVTPHEGKVRFQLGLE